MKVERFSRRRFLAAAGSVAGASWLAAHWPSALAAGQQAAAARDAGAEFETLTATEAADLAAIAAQILPTDELPGANEAGVVYFMDSAMRTFLSGAAEGVRKGLRALNKKAAEVQAGTRFAALPVAEQLRLVEAEQDSEFFGTVRFMTIAGMFAMPVYGGNRAFAGWKLLGFDHRHVWAPPFGHYDAPPSAPKGKGQ